MRGEGDFPQFDSWTGGYSEQEARLITEATFRSFELAMDMGMGPEQGLKLTLAEIRRVCRNMGKCYPQEIEFLFREFDLPLYVVALPSHTVYAENCVSVLPQTEDQKYPFVATLIYAPQSEQAYEIFENIQTSYADNLQRLESLTGFAVTIGEEIYTDIIASEEGSLLGFSYN